MSKWGSWVVFPYYHGDHLGSINLVTDQTGAQVELAEYAPFGSFSRKEASPLALSQSKGNSSPYYTGKRLDSSTGLYYYGARYYDPELGRFIQPDTIVQAPSDPQTLNRYTYARNNPLIYTDPTGHSFWKKVGKFFRQIVAPIMAAVTAIVLAPFGPVIAAWGAMAVYNGFATFGANLERGRGFFESLGRGYLAFAATSIDPIGGSAATAALNGGDPAKGAIGGAINMAFAVAGSFIPAIPFPGSVLTNAAIAAGSSAAGAAATGGDPGQAAWRSAAAAATMTIAQAIANGDFQHASDTGQKTGGASGKASAEAKAAQEQTRTLSGYAPRQMGADGGSKAQLVGALEVSKAQALARLEIGHHLIESGFHTAEFGTLVAVAAEGFPLAQAGGVATALYGVGKAIQGGFEVGGAWRDLNEIRFREMEQQLN